MKVCSLAPSSSALTTVLLPHVVSVLHLTSYCKISRVIMTSLNRAYDYDCSGHVILVHMEV